MKNLTESTIIFTLASSGDSVKFKVYHNLTPEQIEAALESWGLRCKSYTAKSFCKYVMSKNESFVCMTEEQWKRLNQTV